MTVLAQISMIGAAAIVPRLSARFGHSKVLGAALFVVVVRAALASTSASWWIVGVVEILEGLAMGFAGVAIPALVARAMADTGHAGAGLGGVMMAYGAGAAVSPVLAGLVAQVLGFSAAFIALGVVAAVGLAIWVLGSRMQESQDRDRRAER